MLSEELGEKRNAMRPRMPEASEETGSAKVIALDALLGPGP